MHVLSRAVEVLHNVWRDTAKTLLGLGVGPFDRIREERNDDRSRARRHDADIVCHHRRKIARLVTDWHVQKMRKAPISRLLRAKHSSHHHARLLRRDRRRLLAAITASLNRFAEAAP